MTILLVSQEVAGPVLSAPTASVLVVVVTGMFAVILEYVRQRIKRRNTAIQHETQLEQVTAALERLNALRSADLLDRIHQVERERDDARQELRDCNAARIAGF